jgi:hypothetical protein
VPIQFIDTKRGIVLFQQLVNFRTIPGVIPKLKGKAVRSGQGVLKNVPNVAYLLSSLAVAERVWVLIFFPAHYILIGNRLHQQPEHLAFEVGEKSVSFTAKRNFPEPLFSIP